MILQRLNNCINLLLKWQIIQITQYTFPQTTQELYNVDCNSLLYRKDHFKNVYNPWKFSVFIDFYYLMSRNYPGTCFKLVMIKSSVWNILINYHVFYWRIDNKIFNNKLYKWGTVSVQFDEENFRIYKFNLMILVLKFFYLCQSWIYFFYEYNFCTPAKFSNFFQLLPRVTKSKCFGRFV